MNICYNPQQEYYSQGCPYRDTCPIRTQCPYCPHQHENNNHMIPGMCGNANMGMQYYDQAYDPMYCPNLMYENYGYDNLYHATNLYPAQIPESYDNIMPGYNKNGYINPNENINSPWDNNRMYAEKNPY